MKYSDVLQNQHFRVFASLIRKTMYGKSYYSTRQKMMTAQACLVNARRDFIVAFTEFLAMLVEESDYNSQYSASDMDWLLETLDEPEWNSIFGLMFAYGSAPDDSRINGSEAEEAAGGIDF